MSQQPPAQSISTGPSPAPSPLPAPLLLPPATPPALPPPNLLTYGWPGPAQAAVALLLALSLALLGWHLYLRSAWSARPMTLAEGDWRIDLNQADRGQLAQLPGV